MRPFIEYGNARYYLPQEVKVHRFEVNVMEENGKTRFLLCPIVPKRYVQATGGLMERKGKELNFIFNGNYIARASFPLGEYETCSIAIDYKAAAQTPVSLSTLTED